MTPTGRRNALESRKRIVMVVSGLRITVVKTVWRKNSMNRNRFIQELKSNIQLSEKERRRIIRRSLQKYSWKTKCTVAMEEFAELQ